MISSVPALAVKVYEAAGIDYVMDHGPAGASTLAFQDVGSLAALRLRLVLDAAADATSLLLGMTLGALS